MKLVISNLTDVNKRIRLIKLSGDGRVVAPKYAVGTDEHDGSLDLHLSRNIPTEVEPEPPVVEPEPTEPEVPTEPTEPEPEPPVEPTEPETPVDPVEPEPTDPIEPEPEPEVPVDPIDPEDGDDDDDEEVDLNQIGLDITLSGVMEEATYLALAEKLGGVIGQPTTVERDEDDKVIAVTHFNEDLDPHDIYANSFVIDRKVDRATNGDIFKYGLKFIDSYRVAKESVERIRANNAEGAIAFNMIRFLDDDNEVSKDYTLAELEDIGVYDDKGDLYFGFLQNATGDFHSRTEYEAVPDLNDEGGLTYSTTYELNGKLPTKIRMLSAEYCDQLKAKYPTSYFGVTSPSFTVSDKMHVNATELDTVVLDHTLTEAEIKSNKVNLTLMGGMIVDKFARNVIDSYGGYDNQDATIDGVIFLMKTIGNLSVIVDGTFDSYAYYHEAYHKPLTENGDTLLMFPINITIDLSKLDFVNGVYESIEEIGVIKPVLDLAIGREVSITGDDVGFTIPLEYTIRKPGTVVAPTDVEGEVI